MRSLLSATAGLLLVLLPTAIRAEETPEYVITEKEVSDAPCVGCQDVLGVYSGRACKTYSPPEDFFQNGYSRKTIEQVFQGEGVASSDFVTDMSYQKKNDAFKDTIKVYCTFPTLGRSVYAFSRSLKYESFQDGPELSQLEADIRKKYGQPQTEISIPDTLSKILTFTVNGKGEPVEVPWQMVAPVSPEPSDIKEAANSGLGRALYVTIQACGREPTRACGLMFFGIDFVRAAQSFQELNKATAEVQKMAEEKYARKLKASPGIAPKL